ncbi:MAG TPA: hypothetical protein VKX49_12650 [Bryobacteraceae bacterium]|nr:hypothetical protein [Bryobacteraceae bacterium]
MNKSMDTDAISAPADRIINRTAHQPMQAGKGDIINVNPSGPVSAGDEPMKFSEERMINRCFDKPVNTVSQKSAGTGKSDWKRGC